jgi:poly(3-hydroxybutyrate) depolymerase
MFASRGAHEVPPSAGKRQFSANEPDAPQIDFNRLFVQRTLSMARLKLSRVVRVFVFFGIVTVAVATGDKLVFGQTQQESQAPAEGQFVPRVFKDAAGEHKYQVFVPAHYANDKKWPVILYLHGAGERGSDGVLQTTVGLGPFAKERAATFPFIVVFPQCEDTQGRILTAWSPTSPDGHRALAILDAVEKEFAVDTNRRVLTGWSMGGYGTWSLGAADPRHWSALVPVSGVGDAAWAAKLTEIPIWAFAGVNDQVVLARATRQMIDAVRHAGGHPIYSEMPEVGHDVWKLAYNDNRLYQWMLNPASSMPNGQETTAASPPPARRTRSAAHSKPRSVQPAEEGPFIPAVTIPQALYVRLGNEAIRALANSAPRLIPPNALTGRINDIYSSTQASGYTFSVQFAGVQYSAQLERVWAKAYAKDRLNIQLGLRNVNLVISNTYVQGEGRSAAAGPINVSIGNRYPVWLSFDVTPYVSEGQLKLQLVGTRFEIPNDNWYVTPPYGIRVSGLGMTEERVSSALVEGIYGQKSRIEQEAASIVPSLLPMFEERLKFDQVSESAAAIWPLPVYRPRLRIMPEKVAVDEKGISLVMGVVAAAPDPRKAPATPRVARSGGIDIGSVPQDTDLRLGLAPNILDPLSRMLVDENIARVNVLDIPDSTFAGIADRKVLSGIIPDVANLPPDAEFSAELILTAPVQVRDASTKSSTSAPSEMAQKGTNRPVRVTALKVTPTDKAPEKKAPDKKAPDKKTKSPATEPAPSGPRPFEFFAPKLVIEVSVNENHSSPQWKPYAHFEYELTQAADVTLMQRGYAERAIRLGWTGKPRVKAAGRFAKGYVPKNPEVDTDKLRDLFALSWIAWMQTASATQVVVPDVDFGYAKLRLDGVHWTPPVLSVLFDQPTLEITNTSTSDLVYETKDVDSVWSEPYTLKPGKSHYFKISDPLLYRRLAGGQVVQTYTLAAGSHFEYRAAQKGGVPDLYNVTVPTTPAAR